MTGKQWGKESPFQGEREKKADLPGKGEVRAAYDRKAMGKRIPLPGGEGKEGRSPG
jgi:hypothetical protein